MLNLFLAFILHAFMINNKNLNEVNKKKLKKIKKHKKE